MQQLLMHEKLGIIEKINLSWAVEGTNPEFP
jgi:hypothetical protein